MCLVSHSLSTRCTSSFWGQLTIPGQYSNMAHYLIFLQQYLSSKLLLMQKCEFLQTFLFASPTQFCDILSIQQIFNRTQSLDPLFWLPDSMIAFQWVATIKHGGELTESEGFWHFYVSCCEESDWHHSSPLSLST